MGRLFRNLPGAKTTCAGELQAAERRMPLTIGGMKSLIADQHISALMLKTYLPSAGLHAGTLHCRDQETFICLSDKS